MDDAEGWRQDAHQFLKNAIRVVWAGIVDNDDFVIVRDFAERLERANDHRRDGASIIIAWKENRNTWFH
jgi:hypothetical protein